MHFGGKMLDLLVPAIEMFVLTLSAVSLILFVRAVIGYFSIRSRNGFETDVPMWGVVAMNMGPALIAATFFMLGFVFYNKFSDGKQLLSVVGALAIAICAFMIAIYVDSERRKLEKQVIDRHTSGVGSEPWAQ